MQDSEPLEGSWELADGLMHTLSEPLPPDSPVKAKRSDMRAQIQADAMHALMSSSNPQTRLRAIQLLTTHSQGDPERGNTPTFN